MSPGGFPPYSLLSIIKEICLILVKGPDSVVFALAGHAARIRMTSIFYHGKARTPKGRGIIKIWHLIA